MDILGSDSSMTLLLLSVTGFAAVLLLFSRSYYLCLAFYIAAKLISAPIGGRYLKASADRDRSEVKRLHNKKDNKKKA